MPPTGRRAAALLPLALLALRLAAQPASTPPAEEAPAAAAGQPLDLQSLMDEWQATLRWDALTETGTIVLGRGTPHGAVVFQPGSPWILLNYRELLYGQGLRRQDGRLLVPAETAAAIRDFFRRESQQQARVATILIDPGHGGKDTGAVGTITAGGKARPLQEKDVVLKVGQRLRERLAGRYPDKRILMSRSDDTYIRLEERTELANGIGLRPNEAIIFLSIHANASLNRKVRGYEVWYLPPDYRRDLIDPKSLEADNREIAPILNVLLEEEFSIESVKLARQVLAGLDREVGAQSENRGIKAESWFVVRNARMPSVLIELGFVTHPEEAALLEQEQYLKKLVDAIYTGVDAFVADFERSRGFTE